MKQSKKVFLKVVEFIEYLELVVLMMMFSYPEMVTHAKKQIIKIRAELLPLVEKNNDPYIGHVSNHLNIF